MNEARNEAKRKSSERYGSLLFCWTGDDSWGGVARWALTASISATMVCTSSKEIGSRSLSHGNLMRSFALLMPASLSAFEPANAAIRWYVCHRVALHSCRCRRS